MATITTAIRVQDAMTPAFHSMNNALNIVLNSFEALQNSTSNAIDTASIKTAREELANANTTIQQVESNIKNSNEQQKRLNDNIDDMSVGFEKAESSSSSFFKSLMGFSIFQKAIGLISSQVDSAISRLDTLNNYPKVMSNLGIDETQANASKAILSEKLKGLPTTLNDAVSSVQRFTSANGNIEKSTQMFLALNNAILAGGGSTQVQQSALEQLSQSYAKGKPDMMEWRTAMTAMPAQLKQIANAMGYVDATALGEDLRAGKVSMNDFMNTLIQLNEEGINGFQSFEEQARNATSGFATSIANMKSSITRGITSIIDGINNTLQSMGLGTIQEGIQKIGSTIEKIFNKISKCAKIAIKALNPVFKIIKSISNFISKNWTIIAPIIMGIVGAFVAYKAILAGHAIAVGISTALEWLHNIATVAQAKALLSNVSATLLATNSEYALAVATAQATVAQASFNTSLLACPITWIIILIFALIVALTYLWFTNDKVAKGIMTAWDYIRLGANALWMGIRVVAIGLKETFLAVKLTVLKVAKGINQAWESLKVGLMEIDLAIRKDVEGLANAFVDTINIIIRGMKKLSDSGIGGIVSDKIAGISELDKVDLTTTAVADIETEIVNGRAIMEDFDNKINDAQQEFDKYANEGSGEIYKRAENLTNLYNKLNDTRDDRVAKRNDWIKNTEDAIGNALDRFNFGNDLANQLGDVAGDTKKIADNSDISEEDLKYLRDLAERETVNRFTTVPLSIEINNNNSINGEQDIDGIVDKVTNKLTSRLEEELEYVSEGIHE